jgi:hypothetical protein
VNIYTDNAIWLHRQFAKRGVINIMTIRQRNVAIVALILTFSLVFLVTIWNCIDSSLSRVNYRCLVPLSKEMPEITLFARLPPSQYVWGFWKSTKVPGLCAMDKLAPFDDINQHGRIMVFDESGNNIYACGFGSRSGFSVKSGDKTMRKFVFHYHFSNDDKDDSVYYVELRPSF